RPDTLGQGTPAAVATHPAASTPHCSPVGGRRFREDQRGLVTETENGKHISILNLPGDILIIPEATSVGEVKGGNMQYHSNSGKEEGFLTLCEKELAANSKCAGAGVVVEHGTHRQVLKLDTNGPCT
ncbi:hypothetical protein E2I00_008488, partial [Balaenoptera physalus]